MKKKIMMNLVILMNFRKLSILTNCVNLVILRNLAILVILVNSCNSDEYGHFGDSGELSVSSDPGNSGEVGDSSESG